MENLEAECRGLADVIARIGDKWTVMVCGHLSEGTHRFNALKHRIPGISHRMLTITLRGLERDGLVARKAYATVPPKVEYCLTPLGRSLTEPLAALASWARENRQALEQSRAAFDRRTARD
ncbi:winged helix-turn-helix transcriptional regulator [Frateuria aurantia]|uniref:Putative transcriptional regulator n=1 Tax=Frateuria aurantia (strain ATCC 33424 / DSM 6220 / KCTC 2777 / LMG 1558 / NBRC 3245 / NCIMB 13370) TaxID=767434 RepID=H8L566_FRAAD|nr:helix-turn-helix domain-containing protein [Frateuria aurantia]AFC86645.1 putative transcriptional regulator [Frateuria aurantia DSM 6220]